MKRLGLLLVLALSLAGCSATKKVAANMSPAQEEAALVGNWTGTATPAAPAVGSIPVQMSSQDGQNFNLTLDLSAFNPACENAVLGFTADLYQGPVLANYSGFTVNLPTNGVGRTVNATMFSPATDDVGLLSFVGTFASTTTLSMTMGLQTQVLSIPLGYGFSPSSCVLLQPNWSSNYTFTLTKQ
jgi:hypothetical protein